jgi:hypothetical protein
LQPSEKSLRGKTISNVTPSNPTAPPSKKGCNNALCIL